MIRAVADLLEVPGLSLLLVLAGDALVLDPQLGHCCPEIGTLGRIYLDGHLLVGQTCLQGALLLQ